MEELEHQVEATAGNPTEDEVGESQGPGTSVAGSRFGGLHARTYEMELLLSGAVVFALTRVPPVLDRFFARLLTGLTEQEFLIGLLARGYLVLMVYALIATFVLHLAMRGFWIGLLGLESVFPAGIRWDELKAGPFARERFRREVGSLAQAVDRIDDLCSLAFSFGFLIVITFVHFFLVVLASATVAVVVTRLLWAPEWTAGLFWGLLGVVLGLQIVVLNLDRWLGAKVRRDGLPGRFLRGLVWLTYHISYLRWSGPVQLTLGSNLRESRLAAAIVVACLGLGVFQLGTVFVEEGLLRFDNRSYFPADLCEHGLDPQHYRDRRGPGAIRPREPSIQSELVAGPFLELSLPYRPRHLNPLVADRCPGVEPLRRSGLALFERAQTSDEEVRAAADCLGSFAEVRLDGVAVGGLVWDFAVEPGSELEALVSRIPARDLEGGRHELEVVLPPRPGRADGEPVRHRIPFWR